ncbi:MAG TPA: MIP family channel protein [Puia sp.]|jgi:aquaporin NIP|nr:MIP family channel protein [Puia sp.]
MIKRLTGEFLGTFALVFCGTGAIVINQETGGALTHVGIAIVFGLIVMVMILSLGHVSGAHINPAVTIALSVAKKFKRQNIFPYIFAQLAGACLASLILKTLFPANQFLGATLPRGSDTQSFILEFILTFLLMLVILTSTDKKDHSVLVPALAIGSTVGLEALFAGPICGASMNPARSISPALIGWHFQSLWIYILAPVIGALTAVLAFMIIKEDHLKD